jgi:hypothetical protein
MSELARSRGLDHDQFSFRTIRDPLGFRLSGNAKIALNLIVILQRFHIEQKPPFAVPGMIDRPYPDVGNATQREVGLRSGFWRVCELVDQFNLPTTFVVEQDALPLLDGEDILRNSSHEVVAGGRNAATLHNSAMSIEEERGIIRDCRDALTATLSRSVRGWRSPSCAQSPATLRLLAEQGFGYCGDFNNDDRPYALSTEAGSMVSMPMHHFSSDLHNLFVMRQPTQLFFESILKGAKWILQRSEGSPIIIPLVIHPWISGTPHRIGHLKSLLKQLVNLDGLVCANARDMVDAFGERNPQS